MAIDDREARRDARVLTGAMALAGGNAVVLIATGGLVGQMLAPDPALSTVPITIFVLGTAIATVPAGVLMRKLGRRSAYQIGAGIGALAGLVGAGAVYFGLFLPYLLSACLCGVYQAFVVSYRFAAADRASPAYRARAIAMVMIGGVASGLIGPQLVIGTQNLLPPFIFVPTYLAQAALALASMLVLSFLGAGRQPAPAANAPRRSMASLLNNPRLLVAIACGAAAQSLMNLVMTGTPLAMLGCGFGVDQSALTIQWHVLAMYLPGFVVGRIIARFGAMPVAAAGLTLMAACSAVALNGVTRAHFDIALILLGIGWSFAFVAASAMVTECHAPEDRTQVQSLNDLIVFSTTAVASLGAGIMMAAQGWAALVSIVFPVVVLVQALLVWAMRRPREA